MEACYFSLGLGPRALVCTPFQLSDQFDSSKLQLKELKEEKERQIIYLLYVIKAECVFFFSRNSSIACICGIKCNTTNKNYTSSNCNRELDVLKFEPTKRTLHLYQHIKKLARLGIYIKADMFFQKLMCNVIPNIIHKRVYLGSK